MLQNANLSLPFLAAIFYFFLDNNDILLDINEPHKAVVHAIAPLEKLDDELDDRQSQVDVAFSHVLTIQICFIFLSISTLVP